MDAAELAARIMLGDLDRPDEHIADVLGELEQRRNTLSGGEVVVFDCALDFFNGWGGAKVSDVLNRLDNTNFRHFLEALEVKRAVRT